MVLFIINYIYLYADFLNYIVDFWLNDATYTHGFLVLAIIAYLIFLKKNEILNAKLSPSYLMLIPLIIVCSIWLLGYLKSIESLQLLYLPFLIICVCYVIFGKNIAKIILFPILFLFSALPVWGILIPFLQNMTIAVVVPLVKLLGVVPLNLNGHYVNVEVGLFSIEEGCAGLRFFIIALSLSTLYGYLHYAKAILPNLILITVSLLLAIVANWIRVAGIILIAHYTNNINNSIVQDHGNFGWIIFVIITMFPMFFIANRLHIREPQKKQILHFDSTSTTINGKSFNKLVIALLLSYSICMLPAIFIN
jgi:exosortase